MADAPKKIIIPGTPNFWVPGGDLPLKSQDGKTLMVIPGKADIKRRGKAQKAKRSKTTATRMLNKSKRKPGVKKITLKRVNKTKKRKKNI